MHQLPHSFPAAEFGPENTIFNQDDSLAQPFRNPKRAKLCPHHQDERIVATTNRRPAYVPVVEIHTQMVKWAAAGLHGIGAMFNIKEWVTFISMIMIREFIFFFGAVSPVDGRYHSKTSVYSAYFSEYALIRYRVLVEVEYFISLCELPLRQLESVPAAFFPRLREIYENFSETDALKVKDIEKVTNHDVKAVEYFLKEKFELLGLADHKEFIHFGLTSQDINNTAVPLSIKKALDEV